MKKYVALLLAFVMVLSLVACAADDKTTDETKEETKEQKNNYVMSELVDEQTVIDGVMTDIDGDDPILQKTTPQWLDTCVLYEVNVRQYTEEGTFKAFEEHLDRLKSMGINTLWFMPIHPISKTERKGTLGSYYAVDDYKAVNPEFGTMEDFQHLVDKAHEMGFKVVLDWVANHTGWDHKWITEHPEWYDRDENGEITYSYDWSDIAELNYDNYEMRYEMIQAMQYWVEEVGIDGFRCDHAVGVPASFWNAAVYKLKSINSEIMMLAEVSAAESLTCYAFDSCYNDDFYGDAVSVKGGAAPSMISESMELSDRYVEGSFPMNYLDNHDKNSYDGTIYDRFFDSYETLLAVSFLSPGYPLIYTANEQGYDHEIAFFEKDTITWDENPKYAEYITELSALKKSHTALASSNTSIEFPEINNSLGFAFSRSKDNDKVVFFGSLYYEKIKGINADLGFDSATCVMHYDGKNFDFEDKEVFAKDFENKDFNPYEFYIFTVETEQ